MLKIYELLRQIPGKFYETWAAMRKHRAARVAFQVAAGFALPPVFREIMLKVYQEKLVGPAPQFPAEMEANIDAYLRGDLAQKEVAWVPWIVDPQFLRGSADAGPEGCAAKLALLPANKCALTGAQQPAIYTGKHATGRLVFTNQ